MLPIDCKALLRGLAELTMSSPNHQLRAHLKNGSIYTHNEHARRDGPSGRKEGLDLEGATWSDSHLTRIDRPAYSIDGKIAWKETQEEVQGYQLLK